MLIMASLSTNLFSTSNCYLTSAVSVEASSVAACLQTSLPAEELNLSRIFQALLQASQNAHGISSLSSDPALIHPAPASATSHVTASLHELQIAMAIFTIGSLFNHSCEPVATARFDGRQLDVLTTTPIIPAGKPITITYGPTRALMPSAQQRQKALASYHFVCKCPACFDVDPARESSTRAQSLEIAASQHGVDVAKAEQMLLQCVELYTSAAEALPLSRVQDAIARLRADRCDWLGAAAMAEASAKSLESAGGQGVELGASWLKAAQLYLRTSLLNNAATAAIKAKANLMAVHVEHPLAAELHTITKVLSL
jgi:hypothetical protein